MAGAAGARVPDYLAIEASAIYGQRHWAAFRPVRKLLAKTYRESSPLYGVAYDAFRVRIAAEVFSDPVLYVRAPRGNGVLMPAGEAKIKKMIAEYTIPTREVLEHLKSG